jgi:hypothetical protein
MTDNTRPRAPHAVNGYTALNELIPRFGMFAGPNYAGGQSLGNTTPAASVWQTKPVNFLDEVTRYHDMNYTWNQKVYGEGTAQYDAARWQADKEMFQNVLAWKPPAGDFISTSYRQALI